MISLPKRSGIGLKPEHYHFFLDNTDAIGWLEVHPENYMGRGGPPHHYLSKIRENYALSMHGVGLSLGSTDGVDPNHLKQLKQTIDRYQPEQVSEHLSWSHWKQNYFNDLLPLPYSEDSLKVIEQNIDLVQCTLGRKILVENPSTYIEFRQDSMSETEFLNEMVKKTGCGLLLDINNVFVSCDNHGKNPIAYLENYPTDAIGEIHLAGHSVQPLTDEKTIRVDDHGSEVKDEVWALFKHFCKTNKRRFPVLIEWDVDVPSIDILMNEANKAESILNMTQPLEVAQ